MKAMIFAAGLGTRLKPLTDTIPKALVPLAGKPLLQWQIERLKAAGITDIVVNVHHFPDMIINYLHDNDNFGCRIAVSDERDMLLETGGGLRKAEEKFRSLGVLISAEASNDYSQANVQEFRDLEIGKGVCLREVNVGEAVKRVAVLSIGAIGNTVSEAIGLLSDKARGERREARVAHYDMRWLKPMDEQLLHEIGKRFTTIITVEDGVISGGLGSAVLEFMADNGYTPRVIRLGVNDQFVEHGSTKELYHLLKLDKEGICESLLQALEQ